MREKPKPEGWWNEPDPKKALDEYLKREESLYFQAQVYSLRKLIPRPSGPNMKALDYGCGGGALTVMLAMLGYNVYACDSSICSVGACREYLDRKGFSQKVVLRKVDPPDYWIDLPDDFDLVLAKDVVEHIEDDQGFLKSVAARLNPSGCLVIATQNSSSWNYKLEAPRQFAVNPDWCGWHPDEHVRFYNKGILSDKLIKSGLKPVKWRSAYMIPCYEFRSGIAKRFRNFLHKIGMEKAFFWPEMILGGVYPFNGYGWSIQVRAERI